MNTEIEKGLSEFIQNVEVIRTGDIAEIIVDYDAGRPIILLGFSTDANKSDFEVTEEGYHYYQRLKEHIAKNR